MRRWLLLLFALFFSPLQALQVSSLSFIEDLRPGQTRQVELSLTNEADYEELVNLEVTNFSCNSDGEAYFDPPSTPAPRSNALWVTLGQPSITLKPKESRSIYYTVHVPEKVEPEGSYWSTLLICPEGPPLHLRKEEISEDGLRLEIKFRYAHHIVTTVGKGAPKLHVFKKEVKTLGNRSYLVLHVSNTGERFLAPELTLNLYDTKGALQKTLSAPSEYLYPGLSQAFFIDLNGISERQLKEYSGFLLFDAHDAYLFGDRFAYPK